MHIVRTTPVGLEKEIGQFLKEDDTYFVFSTDVVMNSWIDWIVSHPAESGMQAVPLERFTAWDKFKSNFVTAHVQDKTAIPSVLRKIFTEDILRTNSREKFLTTLIPEEYAENTETFANWISKMLPPLNLWFKKIIEKFGSTDSASLDAEDNDFLELHSRYSQFLENNKMYEPSWITPDFSEDRNGKKFVIVYPEILEDYADYIEIFNSTENITVINLPEEIPAAPECTKYSDSRKELRKTILKIRNLVKEKKAAWNDIALCVPNMDIYRPYLERELANYDVPFVIRAGLPLTKNCAGAVFTEIKNCYDSEFSYASVRALLLDEYIPWREDIRILKQNLIEEGCRMSCLMTYDDNGEKKDSWIMALSSVKEDYRELEFYKNFKRDVKTICEASSFANIHEAWKIFEDNYLSKDSFSKSANNIIAHCINTLKSLAEIDEKFCAPVNLEIKNPFRFFMNELDSKKYTPQNKASGISVYPYRLSAAAKIKYQFVIDASQKNLEIVNKRLSFLSAEKRIALGLADEDKAFNMSRAFIRLYSVDGNGNTEFSFAEDTFTGFAIAHNYLTEKNPSDNLDDEDFILNEKKWFLSGGGNADGKTGSFAFSDLQKAQFSKWRTTKISEPESSGGNADISDQINYVLVENRNKHNQEKDDRLVITGTDMSSFFPCPRNWVFSKVFAIGSTSLDADLVSNFDIGNIKHKVLEDFVNHFKNKGDGTIPLIGADGSFSNEQEIQQLVQNIIEEILTSGRNDILEKPLAKVMLLSQKQLIINDVMYFLHAFCLPVEKKGFGGFTIVDTEQWINCQSENGEWRYSGRVDCILACEGTVYIIDYKTGGTPKIKDCIVDNDGNLGNFQIPLYVKMWNENHETAKAENALFFSINKAEPTFIMRDPAHLDRRSSAVTPDEYVPTLAAMENYAGQFCDTVKSGNFTPDINPYSVCTGCGYQTICRTLFSISGRKLK